MTRIFRIVAAALLLAAACSRAGGGALRDYDGSRFKPGQEWSYLARPGESRSTITVLKVERHEKLGTIVHVSVNRVKIRNPLEPGDPIEEIQHLPLSEAALLRSVTIKVRDGAPTDGGDAGYRSWREAFDAGRGGIFTTTVAESVGHAEQMMSRGAR